MRHKRGRKPAQRGRGSTGSSTEGNSSAAVRYGGSYRGKKVRRGRGRGRAAATSCSASLPSSSSSSSSSASASASASASSSYSSSHLSLPSPSSLPPSLPAIAMPQTPHPPLPSRPPQRQTGHHGPQQRPSKAPLNPQVVPPWKLWDSVAIRLANVPKEANTFTLWQSFSKEGSICSIDLFEDFHGHREHKGKLRFKPPPANDFWKQGVYSVVLPDGHFATISIALDIRRPDYEVPSPVRPDVRYPAELTLPIKTLDIGVLVDENTYLPMRTVGIGNTEKTSLVIDLKLRVFDVYFQLPIFNPRNKFANPADILHQYRVRIPFPQLTQIFQSCDGESGCVSHLTCLDSPPLYHRRVKNIPSTFMDDNNWKDADAWFRQTYIVHNPQGMASLPVSLRKMKQVIDIGRWNTFKITYPKDFESSEKFTKLCDILKDYNVAIQEEERFTQWDRNKELAPPIWKWIDLSDTQPSKKSSSLEELIDDTYVFLSFSVRYQLEVCISNGYLSEFTMSRDFAVRLSNLGETKARRLLEHVATKKIVYYDPMKIFDILFVKGVTDSRIPPYCCYMRSARITPGTIYYNTPTVDISNRVIRQYIEYADRFLRVSFTDEKLWGRINSTTSNTMDEAFTRIKRALVNGIVIGDRRYEFLAFGNSQFREHGAYFFAPLPNLTADNIRAWMGHFDDIRNVAKHAARLGQCFSTTRALAGCPVQVQKIDDVERNGYTFSDGVGLISKFLAQMAMSELRIKTPNGEPPSAFQFRLGGSKGMLTVDPRVQPQEVHIRNSQYKFPAKHNGLEIIRWSQSSMATLNRQLIVVLSSLGIADKVFHNKLKTMMTSLDEAMTNDHQAIYLLKKYVDPNQMTLLVSQMVVDGFRRSNDPFITSVMTLWRAWTLKYLKEKAKIVLDKGVCLLGCMDETGTLKGQFADSKPKEDASYEEKAAALPEIFLQVPRHEHGGKYEVIESICILSRNPSLHPGDIRVVRAVNVPQLSHLQDVVVFPQTGDQDIPSMCSGGDLDGDDYLVVWDPDLIPYEWFSAPMKYTSNKARDLDHDVTVDEITSFFVTYMKNDCLPRIAHAHLAWADRLEDGVNEEKCMKLAQLHSDAVDYNKTGNPAIMTRSLTPRMWPHFMEKKGKPPSQVYKSPKILGQLYDAVERVDFVPSLEMPFDKRILDCPFGVSDDLTQFARELKSEYDAAMRRLMAQHEIKTEFEIWTTFVLSHSSMNKDYKFHEEIGQLSTYLREGFRKQCYEKVGGHNFEQLAPLAAAMYRITHEEMSEALEKHRRKNPKDEKHFHKSTPKMAELPLISFPWLLPHILGKIAMGHYELPAAPDGQKVDTQVVEPPVEASEAVEADDPFGLFTGDEDIPRRQPKPDPNVDPSLSHGGRRESLDELVDFGFSGMSQLLPAPVTSPTTAPVDHGLNLMDLNNSPKREVQKDKKRVDENVPIKVKHVDASENENVAMAEKGDFEPVNDLTEALFGGLG